MREKSMRTVVAEDGVGEAGDSACSSSGAHSRANTRVASYCARRSVTRLPSLRSLYSLSPARVYRFVWVPRLISLPKHCCVVITSEDKRHDKEN